MHIKNKDGLVRWFSPHTALYTEFSSQNTCQVAHNHQNSSYKGLDTPFSRLWVAAFIYTYPHTNTLKFEKMK